MADESDDLGASVGAAAKHFHLAARTLMDAELREHDLGPTQWYTLWQLVNVGPTLQRDMSVLLRIERATLSGIVTTLVRKGLVEQTADAQDQRQRLLRVTEAGRALWATLPNPVRISNAIAFDGVDPAELALVRRILEQGTQRILDHASSAAAADPR